MSEDLTKKLPKNDSVTLILTAIKNLDTQVRSSFDNLVPWISSIDSRLQKLEQKVEQRLYDTRPMWHKLAADIGQLQAGQEALQEGQEALRSEVDKINNILGNTSNSST